MKAHLPGTVDDFDFTDIVYTRINLPAATHDTKERRHQRKLSSRELAAIRGFRK